jgi:hypothetical protein
MPIAGSNNIDAPGVLLSMTNLNGLALKDNNNVISIGAGLRWARVYDYLAKSGLVVVGGRLGEIGVSGLLLGGGLFLLGSTWLCFRQRGEVRSECMSMARPSIH